MFKTPGRHRGSISTKLSGFTEQSYPKIVHISATLGSCWQYDPNVRYCSSTWLRIQYQTARQITSPSRAFSQSLVSTPLNLTWLLRGCSNRSRRRALASSRRHRD
ncbi:hypothetical protein L916_13182 [Phytophthora nicotianae]|uniref:Uncharacterized protein n=1 Tax=Phytophthora nicotianae TaxID=4792 RepID=W2IM79_PHYNI|nr:hypothetical protein L916_13182 [Phytophthora nicotianae]